MEIFNQTEKQLVTTLVIKNKMLDFESINLHSLTLVAKNGDNLTLEATIELLLRVVDKPDQLPQWTKQPLTIFQVMEETVDGFVFAARDGDTGINAEIDYKLVNESLTGYFSLEDPTLPETGKKLQVAARDRDAEPDLRPFVYVCAFEVADPTSEICEKVDVIILDDNDNSPTITPAVLTATLNEETAVSLDFGEPVTITDPDLSTNGQFKIELESTNQNWTDAFMVVPTSGYQELTVTISVVDASTIDYEDPNSRVITLTLKVTEEANSSHVVTSTITINVQDVNDEFPEFDKATYEETVKENAAKGTEVLTVVATDGDASDTITYSLLPANAPVVIDSATGVITVKADNSFNYEVQQNVQVQVKAVDEGNHASFADLNITVQDVNDSPPFLTLGSTDLIIDENSEDDTEIPDSTTAIKASDEDTTADLVFSIDWSKSYATSKGLRVSDPGLYTECLKIDTVPGSSVNEASGKLSVANKTQINYEAFDTLYVMISVVDNNQETGAESRSGLQPVLLNNINDEPPVFDQAILDTPKSVIEEGGAGRYIGYVSASDPDGLNNIVYTIIESDETPAGWVEIESASGELRTTSEKIDAELLVVDPKVLTYVVIASDGTLNSTEPISITVEDFNDFSPVFIDPEAGQTVDDVKEHSDVGTVILDSMTATDDDFSDAYGSTNVCFDLDPNNQDYAAVSGIVEVNESTGQVTVVSKENLDRETYPSGLRVQVRAKDNCNPSPGKPVDSRSNTTYFIVNLIDDNDNTPVFETPNVLPNVLETLENEEVFNDLKATDDDLPPFSTLFYSIVRIFGIGMPVPRQDLFYLVQTGDNTADMFVNGSLLGLYGQYQIDIMVADNNMTDPYKNATETFDLFVEDINDNPPLFEFPIDNSSLLLKRKQDGVGSRVKDYLNNVLPDVSAIDADSEENGRVTFTITGDDNAMQYLELSSDGAPPNHAMLLVKQMFDDAPDIFTLYIEATDHGSPPIVNRTTSLVYVISDENVEPVFRVPSQSFPLTEEEETYPPHEFAVAEDANNNQLPLDRQQPIYYYLHDALEGNTSLFEIANSTVNILTVVGRLDHEQYSRHVLQVITSNLDSPPSNPNAEQILTITIDIFDIIDSTPYFTVDLYVGGIAPSDTAGYEVMRVRAADGDDPAVDRLDYTILEETMWASTPELEQIMYDVFEIQTIYSPDNIGIIRTLFTPTEQQEGYFRFDIQATDKVGNLNTTRAQVYMISESNRVYFLFLNTVDEINSNREELRVYNLILVDVLTTPDTTNNLAAVLTIVLIVVTVVLGSLVIVLFVAFVLKTRRLGMHVPNTNKHAVEGSNPVWNEDVPPNYDNVSEGSGDSELIGVEDRPEFGYAKDTSYGLGRGGSQEGGYYSGSEIAAAAAAAAASYGHDDDDDDDDDDDNDRGVASTEL
ncbi:hypothetical protein B566_EDAN003068 [Ephemera danica]|nr:hypothetical protein B566_EDAN003068 [Ephemera danica]